MTGSLIRPAIERTDQQAGRTEDSNVLEHNQHRTVKAAKEHASAWQFEAWRTRRVTNHKQRLERLMLSVKTTRQEIRRRGRMKPPAEGEERSRRTA